jgi:uncharacterized membrane protein YfcA
MHSSETLRILAAFGAALVAGALNSVAGGGSFVSFPTLLFLGMPPIVANATNNTAMWLGTLSSSWGYREELRGARGMWPAFAVAAIGSVVGAELLLRTPEQTFMRAIPWLLLFATVVFASSDVLRRLAGGRATVHMTIGTRYLFPLFLVAIYGGYFGAGIGIMMLALFALSGWTDVNRMNAVKVLLAASINGVAVVPFVLAHKVAWPEAAILTAGAVLGGYYGARIARRVDPKIVRACVIVVGAAMTLYFFVRPYRAGV